jgi:hypothetical protein
LTASVSTDAADALDDMSGRFFGNNQSAAVDWALRLAAVVLADPATRVHGITDPADALASWTGKGQLPLPAASTGKGTA